MQLQHLILVLLHGCCAVTRLDTPAGQHGKAQYSTSLTSAAGQRGWQL
jgi:uncharacterized protein YceK